MRIEPVNIFLLIFTLFCVGYFMWYFDIKEK